MNIKHFYWLLCSVIFIVSIIPCNAQMQENSELLALNEVITEKTTETQANYLDDKFIPALTVYLKSQFPIQNAIGFEYCTSSRISGYAGFGQLSRAYMVIALDILPEGSEEEAVRKQFIKDNIQGGFDFEIGVNYHIAQWKDTYFGANIQFQRFKLKATPQELVEKYDFGDSLGFSDELLKVVNNNELAKSFYENTVIEPIFVPIQLGITVGKRFTFKNNRNLGLNIEASYQFNLSMKTSVESPSGTGKLIVDNFIEPIIVYGTSHSFRSFNLPSIAVKLNYQLGNTIYYPSKRR